MDVYIVRHAQAIDKESPVEDAHRPLTPKGRRDARRLGKALRKEVELDAVITSPLVRAVQTAELFAVGLDFEGQIEVASELGPARDPIDVVKEVLLPRSDLKAVALVGHEPQLGELLSLLLKHDAPSPAKSSAIRVRWESIEQPAKFKWVMHADGDGLEKELAAVSG